MSQIHGGDCTQCVLSEPFFVTKLGPNKRNDGLQPTCIMILRCRRWSEVSRRISRSQFSEEGSTAEKKFALSICDQTFVFWVREK
jgi:hypothetical protein